MSRSGISKLVVMSLAVSFGTNVTGKRTMVVAKKPAACEPTRLPQSPVRLSIDL